MLRSTLRNFEEAITLRVSGVNVRCRVFGTTHVCSKPTNFSFAKVYAERKDCNCSEEVMSDASGSMSLISRTKVFHDISKIHTLCAQVVLLPPPFNITCGTTSNTFVRLIHLTGHFKLVNLE